MGVPPGQGQVILTIQEINTSLESTDARGGLFMKRKVGTLIEEDVIKLAKRRAIEENRPLSDLIQDALVAYLGNKAPDPRTREAAYRTFCEHPIRLNPKQFKGLLEEDATPLSSPRRSASRPMCL